jgi:hypothetical protein
MNKYNNFLLLFIVEVAAFCIFIYNYLKVFIAFSFETVNQHTPNDPFALFGMIFNPTIIISFIVLLLTSWLTRIFGILSIAKNKTITEGEKVIWVIGFVFMSFIASIVFLFAAKKKGFME